MPEARNPRAMAARFSMRYTHASWWKSSGSSPRRCRARATRTISASTASRSSRKVSTSMTAWRNELVFASQGTSILHPRATLAVWSGPAPRAKAS